MISIIVPVYNVEHYIKRCITSILAQTFLDYELWLIDDGSTDNSGKICDDYSNKDTRIRVIHKPNGGASSARNVGIDNATGQYITFIDSDDYIEDQYLQNLYNESNFELVISDFTYEHFESYPPKLESDKLRTKNEIIEHIRKYSNYYEFVVSKLFKTQILNDKDIRFNERLKAGEDMTFIYNYLEHIKTISVIPKEDYHYDVSASMSLSKQMTLYNNDYFFQSVYQAIWTYAPKGELRSAYISGRSIYFQYRIKDIIFKNNSIIETASALKTFLSKSYIHPFLVDKNVMHKGFRGKLFDFLALRKHWIWLVIYAKFFNNKGY